MEGNKDGITTIYRNDALAIPAVAVFIHKDAAVDALEIVGHEGYHYLRGSANRDVYNEVLAANIDFASKAFIDYQQKYVEDMYFAEDVEVGSEEWALLMEEVFAYITGDVHAGDPKGEVRAFLRDYGTVKSAWDTLVETQTQKVTAAEGKAGVRGSSNSNIRYSLAEEMENVSEEKPKADVTEAKPDLRSSMPRKAAGLLHPWQTSSRSIVVDNW